MKYFNFSCVEIDNYMEYLLLNAWYELLAITEKKMFFSEKTSILL